MKKILFLGLINCLFFQLTAMHFNADPEHIAQVKAAQDAYTKAVNSLDRSAIAAATAQIKEARTHFPWWKQWVGYANLSTQDQFDIKCLLSDDYVFRQFEGRIDHLSWIERQRRDKELGDIRDTIARSLGQGVYIDARDAYWHLMHTIKECDPQEVTQATKTLKKVRDLFSWRQKWGLMYFTEGDFRNYDYKNRIFDNAALAEEVLRNLHYCRNTNHCIETVQALEQEIPVQPLAIRESNRTDGFAGINLQYPIVLAAFYKLGTPLNSAQLLAYAEKQNNKEMRETILQQKPELKN